MEMPGSCGASPRCSAALACRSAGMYSCAGFPTLSSPTTTKVPRGERNAESGVFAKDSTRFTPGSVSSTLTIWWSAVFPSGVAGEAMFEITSTANDAYGASKRLAKMRSTTPASRSFGRALAFMWLAAVSAHGTSATASRTQTAATAPRERTIARESMGALKLGRVGNRLKQEVHHGIHHGLHRERL